eukprot:tig00000269_g23711.t1
MAPKLNPLRSAQTNKLNDFAQLLELFQTFALIGQSRLNWPPILSILSGWLTALNLNPQIARPQCSIGAAGAAEAFFLQWKLTLAAPLILIGFGVFQVAFLFAWSRCAWRVYGALRRVFPRLPSLEDDEKKPDGAKEIKGDKTPQMITKEVSVADSNSDWRAGEFDRLSRDRDTDRDDVVSTSSRVPDSEARASYRLPPETCIELLDGMEAILQRVRAARKEASLEATRADDRRLARAAEELERIVGPEALTGGTLPSPAPPASRDVADRLWKLTIRSRRYAFGSVAAESDDEAAEGAVIQVPQGPDPRLAWCAEEATALACSDPSTVFAERVRLLVQTASDFEVRLRRPGDRA